MVMAEEKLEITEAHPYIMYYNGDSLYWNYFPFSKKRPLFSDCTQWPVNSVFPCGTFECVNERE